jgi:hypothetical protein
MHTYDWFGRLPSRSCGLYGRPPWTQAYSIEKYFRSGLKWRFAGSMWLDPSIVLELRVYKFTEFSFSHCFNALLKLSNFGNSLSRPNPLDGDAIVYWITRPKSLISNCYHFQVQVKSIIRKGIQCLVTRQWFFRCWCQTTFQQWRHKWHYVITYLGFPFSHSWFFPNDKWRRGFTSLCFNFLVDETG